MTPFSDPSKTNSPADEQVPDLFCAASGIREAGSLIRETPTVLDSSALSGANVSPQRGHLLWMNFTCENPNLHTDTECSCHKSLQSKTREHSFSQAHVFLSPTPARFQEHTHRRTHSSLDPLPAESSAGARGRV